MAGDDKFVVILLASFKDEESGMIQKVMELLAQDANCEIISTLPQDKVLSFGEITIDPSYRKVSIDGQNIGLTSYEFDVLHLLAKRPGQVFSKDQIYEMVWNEPYYNAKDSVVSMIRRIRQKIEPDPRHPTFILTVWGIGYKFNGAMKRQ